MKQSFSQVVLNYLSDIEGFVLDPATKNPIERVGREVDAGRLTWEEGLKKCRSKARLYRLRAREWRDLESILRKNYS